MIQCDKYILLCRYVSELTNTNTDFTALFTFVRTHCMEHTPSCKIKQIYMTHTNYMTH